MRDTVLYDEIVVATPRVSESPPPSPPPSPSSGAGEAVLVLRGLTKSYRTRTAVDDVSLDVQRGDIYGFLGPNGAGKTTTIRMIVGLIRPTAGSVIIAGDRLSAWHRAPLARIGAIVEGPAVYTYLSGRDNLRMLADLTGRYPRGRIDQVLDRVGLADRAGDKVSEYSHGMKQRLAIAAALLPAPELLLLDEPTNGLDPGGIRSTRELIRSLARDDGLTVFLSSHLLAEVQQLCNRGAVLLQGKKLWEGEIAELLGARLRIRLRATPVARAREVLATGDLALHEAPGEPEALHVHGALAADELVERLVLAGCRVHEVVTEVPQLEEAFLALVEQREDTL
jgi:ABC-2 type transport system ATP-binding protein